MSYLWLGGATVAPERVVAGGVPRANYAESRQIRADMVDLWLTGGGS